MCFSVRLTTISHQNRTGCYSSIRRDEPIPLLNTFNSRESGWTKYCDVMIEIIENERSRFCEVLVYIEIGLDQSGT